MIASDSNSALLFERFCNIQFSRSFFLKYRRLTFGLYAGISRSRTILRTVCSLVPSIMLASFTLRTLLAASCAYCSMRSSCSLISSFIGFHVKFIVCCIGCIFSCFLSVDSCSINGRMPFFFNDSYRKMRPLVVHSVLYLTSCLPSVLTISTALL